jgi:hypothetical protein
VAVEQLRQLFGRLVARLGDRRDLALRELAAGPAPQQGPQLVLGVEADAMVHAEDVAVTEQDVPALTVGVVDQHVEHRQHSQTRMVGVHHRHRRLVRVEALDHVEPTGLGQQSRRDQVHQLLVVGVSGVDPDLERTDPHRSVGQHGHRHHVESADPGHLIGRNLAETQGAGREVPQRALALDRLVDAVDLLVLGLQLAQERRVGRLHQPAHQLQLAVAQDGRQGRVRAGRSSSGDSRFGNCQKRGRR